VASITDGFTLTYQWFRNSGTSNTGGTPINGATNTSYTVPTYAAGTFYYYVVITNTNYPTGGCAMKIASEVATVTVMGEPVNKRVIIINRHITTRIK